MAMQSLGLSIIATKDIQMLRSAIEPIVPVLRRISSLQKVQIWWHTTIKIPPCPDSWAISAEECELAKQKGNDLGSGIWTFWAIDQGKTLSYSNTREVDLTQFFLKAPEGRHHYLSLCKGNNIEDLRKKIQNLLVTPEQGKKLIYKGCSLQDNYTL